MKGLNFEHEKKAGIALDLNNEKGNSIVLLGALELDFRLSLQSSGWSLHILALYATILSSACGV